MKNVSLHLIDCIYKNFKQYLSSGDEFMPQDLNSTDPQKRAIATEIVLDFFKDVVNVSNVNLVRNSNNLLTSLTKANDDLVWVGTSKERFDSTKFKLT